jgi:hypothetical protein
MDLFIKTLNFDIPELLNEFDNLDRIAILNFNLKIIIGIYNLEWQHMPIINLLEIGNEIIEKYGCTYKTLIDGYKIIGDVYHGGNDHLKVFDLLHELNVENSNLIIVYENNKDELKVSEMTYKCWISVNNQNLYDILHDVFPFPILDKLDKSIYEIDEIAIIDDEPNEFYQSMINKLGPEYEELFKMMGIKLFHKLIKMDIQDDILITNLYNTISSSIEIALPEYSMITFINLYENTENQVKLEDPYNKNIKLVEAFKYLLSNKSKNEINIDSDSDTISDSDIEYSIDI